MMNDQPWEEIEHTADWALRVWGEDLRALFENAARGMVSLLGGEADQARQPVSRTITLQAPDPEILLIDWLTELLYLIEEQGMIITQITVHRVADLTLEAEVVGMPGGKFSRHIKAATYHRLAIRRTDEGFTTTVVFDV